MSTRDDAKLSDKERAALAGLEAEAEADDPGLAAHLRGRRGGHRKPLTVPPQLTAASRTALGPIVAVLGLFVVVLTLSASVAVAALGLVVMVAGATMSSVLVRSVISARAKPPGEPETPL